MNSREKSEKVFIELDEAFDMLERHFSSLDVVEKDLHDAHGYVLAQDVVCREGHPPFSRSAMDGYAVLAQDLARGDAELKLAETVRAGVSAGESLKPGTCVKIMTGAPLPAGADTVVMQEYTEEKDGIVHFKTAAQKGENIRFEGEDIKPGQPACRRGTLLTPPVLGTCALVGAIKLKVFRKPALSIIVTGDEITEPDNPEPPYGFIRNSNGPMILALLREMQLEGKYFGIVPDDPEKLRKSFEEGLASDLLLVTGGVSVGQFDYVTEVVRQLGFSYLYRKVKVKPGKPVNFAFGKRGRVFGLPGNPVSVFTSFHVFVKPMLKKMMGLDMIRTIYEGYLKNEYQPDEERMRIAPCRYEFKDGAFELTPLRLNGSADLAGASRANCLAFMPVQERVYKPRDKVRFIKTEQ